MKKQRQQLPVASTISLNSFNQGGRVVGRHSTCLPTFLNYNDTAELLDDM